MRLKFLFYFPFRTYRRACFFIYKTLHPIEVTQYQDPALFGHGTSHSTYARVDQRDTGKYILLLLAYFLARSYGSIIYLWIQIRQDDLDMTRSATLFQFSSVLRIRIYYYADPDPGSKKFPYGSGS